MLPELSSVVDCEFSVFELVLFATNLLHPTKNNKHTPKVSIILLINLLITFTFFYNNIFGNIIAYFF